MLANDPFAGLTSQGGHKSWGVQVHNSALVRVTEVPARETQGSDGRKGERHTFRTSRTGRQSGSGQTPPTCCCYLPASSRECMGLTIKILRRSHLQIRTEHDVCVVLALYSSGAQAKNAITTQLRTGNASRRS